MDSDLVMRADRLGHDLKQAGRSVVTAESCTGGWLGAVLTSIPGSSQWYERGFVSYSNMAKREMLGVKTEIITRHGAVSEATARAMAEGALIHSHADLAVSITGVAGPGGGTAEKPVGTVWFAWAARKQHTQARLEHFDGDRETVRHRSILAAIEGLSRLLASLPKKN